MYINTINLHLPVSHPCCFLGIAIEIALATCFVCRFQVNQCQDAALKLQKKCLACTRSLACQFCEPLTVYDCSILFDCFKTCFWVQDGAEMDISILYIYIYICMYIYMCIHVCMYACMHACIYVM